MAGVEIVTTCWLCGAELLWARTVRGRWVGLESGKLVDKGPRYLLQTAPNGPPFAYKSDFRRGHPEHVVTRCVQP